MDSAVTSSDGVPSAAGVEAVETDAFAVADSPAPGCELMLPGARSWAGRPSIGVDDVRNVLALLNAANIPACVVHVNALRYYGAGRVTSVSPAPTIARSLPFSSSLLGTGLISWLGMGYLRPRPTVQ